MYYLDWDCGDKELCIRCLGKHHSLGCLCFSVPFSERLATIHCLTLDYGVELELDPETERERVGEYDGFEHGEYR